MRTSGLRSCFAHLGVLAVSAWAFGCATQASSVGEGGGGGADLSTSSGADGGGGSDATTTTTSSTTSSSSSGAGGEAPGPAGESCPTAIQVVDGSSFTGVDFSQYADDYTFSGDDGCAVSEFAYQRHDVVFYRDTLAGESVKITEHGELDVIMHAVAGSCGVGACAASVAEQTPELQSSQGLVYTSPIAQTVHFFVESFYDDTPASQLYVDITTQSYDLRFEVSNCGDGSVSSLEGCDDGNLAPGDGCSESCTVETGYLCSGQPSDCVEAPSRSNPLVVNDAFTIVGPDIYAYSDNHDFTGANCAGTFGAGADTRPDLTFEVELAAGDGVRVTEHTDLDVVMHVQAGSCGTTNACTASLDPSDAGEASTGLYNLSPTDQTVYVFVEPYYTAFPVTAFDVRLAVTRCGDGVLEVGEACDDGGKLSGDCCSAACEVEPGFECTGSPSTCAPWVNTVLPTCTGTRLSVAAAGVPVAIPDNQPSGGALLSFPVPNVGTVAGVALRVTVTHDYTGDVDMWLKNASGMPTGDGLDVCTDNGGAGDDFVATVFVDSAATSITAGSAPFTGMYRPEAAFSYFTGRQASGTWTLRVADDVSLVAGTVHAAELALCILP